MTFCPPAPPEREYSISKSAGFIIIVVFFYNDLRIASKNNYFTHRIINIYEDDKGYYYKTQGDNLKEDDPSILRFENIEGKVIGILY